MAYESQGGTWREMITKETFVKALQLIQEQQEINHQFAKALDLVGDGHYVFGVNNKFYDAAMLVLKEAVNDKYDYISWWLYEGEPDYKVWSSDNTEEWNLTELKHCTILSLTSAKSDDIVRYMGHLLR